MATKQNGAAARPLREQRIVAAPQPETIKRPALRVIVPTVRNRRRRASVLGIVASFAVFGFMIGLTAFQAQLAANQIEVDNVGRELRAEQVKLDRNRLAVARLQSPRVVLARAEKLGMKPPTDFTFAAPNPAVVTEVMSAVTGSPDHPVVSQSSTRPDWSAIKAALGANE